MTLTTSRGRTLEADYALMTRAGLRLRLRDPRPLSEIAADLDLLDALTGDEAFDGPFRLTSLHRDDPAGRVSASLERGA